MRHQAFEPVLEDTLSTWDAVKGYAWEVVNLLDVFKKKYIDNVFERFKVRWVYDGRAQKVKAGECPLDTFAPTVRHATHKCLVANATLNGAAPTTLSSRAYIERVAKEELDKPLSAYPQYDTPAAPDLYKHYEAALASRADVDPALAKSYPRKCGKVVFTMPSCRADCALAIGLCTRCLKFPTPEMDAALDRIIVFQAQHADDGPTYGVGDNLGLRAYVDSDWQVDCSTTGWCIMYAGAVVAYGSKRQHCIALSSTEAEIMAASQAAAELLYIRGLLTEMGVDLGGPTTLYVDNSGAVELSKDLKSCQRSRHIERRYLKVRELVAAGHIKVVYCPTADNHADALTKPLAKEPFRRHADALLNIRNVTPVPSPRLRQRTFDVEAAYLQGEFDGQTLYARPPPGYRTHIRGIPVVWMLKVPLYGEADAGRLWNKTLVKQLVQVQLLLSRCLSRCPSCCPGV